MREMTEEPRCCRAGNGWSGGRPAFPNSRIPAAGPPVDASRYGGPYSRQPRVGAIEPRDTPAAALGISADGSSTSGGRGNGFSSESDCDFLTVISRWEAPLL